MSGMLLSILIGIFEKLVTEKFFSKVLITVLRYWSDQTANDYDDKVVDAMAEALGVDSKSMKDLSKK